MIAFTTIPLSTISTGDRALIRYLIEHRGRDIQFLREGDVEWLGCWLAKWDFSVGSIWYNHEFRLIVPESLMEAPVEASVLPDPRIPVELLPTEALCTHPAEYITSDGSDRYTCRCGYSFSAKDCHHPSTYFSRVEPMGNYCEVCGVDPSRPPESAECVSSPACVCKELVLDEGVDDFVCTSCHAHWDLTIRGNSLPDGAFNLDREIAHLKKEGFTNAFTSAFLKIVREFHRISPTSDGLVAEPFTESASTPAEHVD